MKRHFTSATVLILLVKSLVVMSYEPLGCYKDVLNDRAIPYMYNLTDSNGPEACEAKCLEENSSAVMFGLQYEVQCWCGGRNALYDKHGLAEDAEASCEYACPDGSGENCGGDYYISAFSIFDTTPAPTPTPAVEPVTLVLAPVEVEEEEDPPVEEEEEPVTESEEATPVVTSSEDSSEELVVDSVSEGSGPATTNTTTIEEPEEEIEEEEEVVEEEEEDATEVSVSEQATVENNVDTDSSNSSSGTMAVAGYFVAAAVAVIVIVFFVFKIVDLQKKKKEESFEDFEPTSATYAVHGYNIQTPVTKVVPEPVQDLESGTDDGSSSIASSSDFSSSGVGASGTFNFDSNRSSSILSFMTKSDMF